MRRQAFVQIESRQRFLRIHQRQQFRETMPCSRKQPLCFRRIERRRKHRVMQILQCRMPFGHPRILRIGR
jgi:hypothetical protein